MNTSLQDELREYVVQLDAAIDRRAAAPTMRSGDRLRAPAPRRRPHVRRGLMAVSALGALMVAVFVATRQDTSTSAPQIVSVSSDDVSTASDEGSSAPTVTPSTAQEPTLPSSLTSPIVRGDSGPAVARLQERLDELHFLPGPVDGSFGPETEQAVWAFKTLVLRMRLADVSSEVTQEVWAIMEQPVTITPRRTLGEGTTHVEIYLPEQVLAVFTDDRPVMIAHISSGTGQDYCETIAYDTDDNGAPLETPGTKSVCATASTPPGVFQINRSLDGHRVTPIGAMTNPLYFNYGIAIAGADNVPLNPASHGEVRINQTVATVLPSLVHLGDTVYVWGQDGRDPEDYTKEESLPSFQHPDPTATTDLPIAAALVEVPLLNGLLSDNMQALLNERGLAADVRYEDVPYGNVNDGRVISQEPQVGQVVAPGTAISVVIGRALPEPTTAVASSWPSTSSR